MRGKEVEVPDGSRGNIGSRITTMFRDAQKVLYISFHFINMIIILLKIQRIEFLQFIIFLIF